MTCHSCNEPDRQELVAQANRLMEHGGPSAAYQTFIQLASRDDADAQSCTIAGLTALTLGQPEDAVTHLKKAVAIAPDDIDANYNLAAVYLDTDQIGQAKPILEKLLQDNPDDTDILNDLALVNIHNEDYLRAIEYLSKALEVDCDHTVARSNLLQLVSDSRCSKEAQSVLDRFRRTSRSTGIAKTETGAEIRGKKIAIFATQASFIGDIARYLSMSNEIRYYEGGGAQAITALMEWADIAWFEWCDQLLIEATKLPKNCVILCRLHSYEVFTDMPRQVDWSKVDHLLFVSESVQSIFTQHIPAEVNQSVIHNGLSMDKYRLDHTKVYGKRIASVGYINYKKNPTLMLYCFKKLYEYDPQFTFHIAGAFQDSRIELYFEQFLKRHPLPISFDGWVDDMPNWYEDKDYIISTSLFESFHYSIAEGMSSGLIPLIHDWYGADKLYPNEYLFSDPDTFLKLIKQLESSDRQQLAQENRDFINSKYNVIEKHREIGQLLFDLIDTYEVQKHEYCKV